MFSPNRQEAHKQWGDELNGQQGANPGPRPQAPASPLPCPVPQQHGKMLSSHGCGMLRHAACPSLKPPTQGRAACSIPWTVCPGRGQEAWRGSHLCSAGSWLHKLSASWPLSPSLGSRSTGVSAPGVVLLRMKGLALQRILSKVPHTVSVQ